jgi:hypothetical protein
MTSLQLVTIVFAVYGAVLATANLAILLRSKRWRLVVTHSVHVANERKTVAVRAANLGERTVTVTSMFIETVQFKVSGYRRVLQWLASVTRGRTSIHRIEARHAVFWSPSGINLPRELKPGESVELHTDPKHTHFERFVGGRAAVEDGLGVVHRSSSRIAERRTAKTKRRPDVRPA